MLDADVLAREVVAPGTRALADIAARFPGVLSSDGTLDRARLGARVFSDAEERRALNAIVHPRIAERFLAETQRLAEEGVEQLVYDAPLLIENGIHRAMDEVLLVWVPREIQLARLMARDSLEERAAEARLAAQMPLDEKRAFASWVVDNSGSPEATRAQVERIWSNLTGS